uniref:Uncharacterized protein n=1 Tax=Rhizobium leguminosarum TaxID=384 RepID=A0A179BHA4_RHILE|nr:hypothetical protein A4U53_28170 [Rhizobium leguminosarum]
MPSGAALFVHASTYLVFDLVEFSNASECLGGNGCGTGGCQLVKAPADMRPAECQRYGVLGSQRAIAAVAVDLQNADEAFEMGHRTLGLAIRRVDIDDTGRGGALPRPVVAGIRPELPSFGLSPSRIENRGCRLVGEELG